MRQEEVENRIQELERYLEERGHDTEGARRRIANIREANESGSREKLQESLGQLDLFSLL